MKRVHLRPRQLTPEEAKNFGMKASDHLRVLDPMTRRPLPKEGHTVVETSYWYRRVQSGDCEVVKPAPRARGRSSSASKEE